MKKILSISVALLLLTSCAREYKGVILSKHIMPAHKAITYDAPIQMYEERKHPTIYQITIKSEDGLVLTYDVKEEDYYKLQVGNEYVYAYKW